MSKDEMDGQNGRLTEAKDLEREQTNEPGPSSGAEPSSSVPDGKKRRGGRLSPLGTTVMVSVAFVLGMVFLPDYLMSGNRGGMTACLSNLKNLGTAMEMYSTDWMGRYPTSLEQLTPNYLKELPSCPQSGFMNYRLATGPKAAYNVKGQDDYYFLECHGKYHAGVSLPENYPQYDGISGLMVR